jgi:hopanoid biosynthesis associated RND transporter like protein HpnN
MPLILKFSRSLLLLILCATSVLIFFTVRNFKVNTSLTNMMSSDLPFQQDLFKFHEEFPGLVRSIVVVVEGESPNQTRLARNVLVERLRRENTLFKSVYAPGEDPFFDKNGLLYLSLEELEQQGDSLAEMQPFLALLSQDFTLSGLFTVLEQVVNQDDISIKNNEPLIRLFNDLSQTLEHVGQGEKHRMSWQDLVLEDSAASPGKQFILLQPGSDPKIKNPAKQTIKTVKEAAEQLHLKENYGITISITGNPVVNYDDMRSVSTDIAIASLISLILVGIILYLGLGSFRLVIAGLATLMTGLVWTIGFAILVIGQLNMISVTFVVLFIGLGIDFSIQIFLRYKEFFAAGKGHGQAISEAVNVTFNTLLICTISTAIGFYVFVPTAYVGASELGLIAGTGMFFILLASITILPILMNLLPAKRTCLLPLPIGGSIATLVSKYPRPLLAGATVAAVASCLLLPKVTFDANPFNLSDQRSQSVQTAMALFTGDRSSPWTISVMAANSQEAEEIAKELRQLPQVQSVVTIHNLIPKNQEEKLEQIEDMALVMPPVPQKPELQATRQYRKDAAALAQLSQSLDAAISSGKLTGRELSAMKNLTENIHAFEQRLTGATQDTLLFDHLDSALLPDLELLLTRLNMLMQAAEVDLDQLPGDLTSRYISSSGLYRIQVFPRNDLRNVHNLKEFVAAVQTIAPEATDQPVTILGAGTTIVSAFRNATIMAFILITLFLRFVMKTWVEVLLIMVPLLLTLCYAMAAAVLLNIPFNFANIIVVPLLLGIGVDSGIHVVHRVKESRGGKIHILETSTSRAVLFSSLTTVMSFGSLAFMHHAGTAGMGRLLTLSVILMIFCMLILLPAYLEIHNPFKLQDKS